MVQFRVSVLPILTGTVNRQSETLILEPNILKVTDFKLQLFLVQFKQLTWSIISFFLFRTETTKYLKKRC